VGDVLLNPAVLVRRIERRELPDGAAELIGQAYRDAVRSVDGFMDALMAALGEYDPATVFFADHGEALGEHGNFGHEQTLYEENLRVPLFVHNAGETETVDEQLPLRSLPELLVDLTHTATEPFDPHAHTRQFVVSHTEEPNAVGQNVAVEARETQRPSACSTSRRPQRGDGRRGVVPGSDRVACRRARRTRRDTGRKGDRRRRC